MKLVRITIFLRIERRHPVSGSLNTLFSIDIVLRVQRFGSDKSCSP
jgi:hypothetical protein